MTGIVKYEMMIILTENFDDTELKSWSLNYAKKLQNLNASKISVISKGKQDLEYLIDNQKRGSFIQVNFLSIPQYLNKFTYSLKLDSNVLRFLVLNE